MPCQVPTDCSYTQLYELAINSQGFPIEDALAKTALLESHRGRLIPRSNETMPTDFLQTLCTLKLSFRALVGGSSNIVVPETIRDNSDAQLLPSKAKTADDMFFEDAKFTDDGFVKIDLPPGHLQERLANSCDAEDNLYRLRDEKSIGVGKDRRLDFS